MKMIKTKRKFQKFNIPEEQKNFHFQINDISRLKIIIMHIIRIKIIHYAYDLLRFDDSIQY